MFNLSNLPCGASSVCNIQKGSQKVFVSPSYFYMTFSTDDSISGRGFNISIAAEASSCHKVMFLSILHPLSYA